MEGIVKKEPVEQQAPNAGNLIMSAEPDYESETSLGPEDFEEDNNAQEEMVTADQGYDQDDDEEEEDYAEEEQISLGRATRCESPPLEDPEPPSISYNPAASLGMQAGQALEHAKHMIQRAVIPPGTVPWHRRRKQNSSDNNGDNHSSGGSSGRPIMLRSNTTTPAGSNKRHASGSSLLSSAKRIVLQPKTGSTASSSLLSNNNGGGSDNGGGSYLNFLNANNSIGQVVDNDGESTEDSTGGDSNSNSQQHHSNQFNSSIGPPPEGGYTDLRLKFSSLEIDSAISACNSGDPYGMLRFVQFRKGCDTNQRYMYFCAEPSCAEKVFTTKVTLARHVPRDHFGDLKPFHCESCPYKFYCKRDLDFHVVRHMPAEAMAGKYRCTLPGCNFSSMRSGDLKAHVMRHSPDKVKRTSKYSILAGNFALAESISEQQRQLAIINSQAMAAAMAQVHAKRLALPISSANDSNFDSNVNPADLLDSSMMVESDSQPVASSSTATKNHQSSQSLLSSSNNSSNKIIALPRIISDPINSNNQKSSSSASAASASSSATTQAPSTPISITPVQNQTQVQSKSNNLQTKNHNRKIESDLLGTIGESKLRFVCHKCGPCTTIESLIRHLVPLDDIKEQDSGQKTCGADNGHNSNSYESAVNSITGDGGSEPDDENDQDDEFQQYAAGRRKQQNQ